MYLELNNFISPEFHSGLYRSIDDVPGVGLFFVDLTGKILFANKGCVSLTGFQRQELENLNMDRFCKNAGPEISPHSAYAPAGQVPSFLQSGRKVRKDGTSFWANIYTKKIDEPVKGYLMLMIGFESGREKNDSVSFFFDTVSEVPVGIALYDVDKNIFLKINSALSEMLDLSEGKILGRSFYQLFRQNFPDKYLVSETESISQVFECTTTLPSGKSICCICHSSPFGNGTSKDGRFLLFFTDITKEREARNSLLKREKKNSELLDQASEAFFLADLSGKYVDVNRAACRMLGYEKSELIGKRIIDLLPEEDFKKLEESKEYMMKPGVVSVDEWRLKKKNGEFLPVEVSAKILEDGRWQAFVRDISEKKESFARLERSEKKFKGLLDNSHDAIMISDHSGKIEYVNDQLLKWLGYDRSDLYGQPLEVIVPERFRHLHKMLRQKYMSRPLPKLMGERLDIFALCRNGKEIPVDVSLTPLNTESGIIITAVIRDITERKNIEAKQRFLSETSRVLLESLDANDQVQKIADSIVPFLADWCVVFCDHNGELKSTAVCHKEKSKVGQLEKVASQIPFLDLFRKDGKISSYLDYPVIRENVTASWLRSIGDDTFYKDISLLGPRSLVILPLIARRKGIGILFMVMSDSGRKFSPADLGFAEIAATRFAIAIDNSRLFAEAQIAVQAREEILAVVSHDLKNPLTAIKLSASVIPAVSSNQAELDKIVSAISRSADHMERLISDLLDISKISEGKLSLVFKEISLNTLGADVLESFKARAAEKSITLVSSFPTEESVAICDPERIKQVLNNLLSNAIKFTPENGTVKTSLEFEPGLAVFHVSDNGPGIEEGQQAFVFEKYWQAKKTSHLGTGLGLSIAKGLVEAHGGKIWFDTKPGTGTTFHFVIPTRHAGINK